MLLIKFQITFSDNRITFIEYVFHSWKAFDFDMNNYNKEGIRTDNKTVCNFSVKKAIQNLLSNAKKNNAKIKIVERIANLELTNN